MLVVVGHHARGDDRAKVLARLALGGQICVEDASKFDLKLDRSVLLEPPSESVLVLPKENTASQRAA